MDAGTNFTTVEIKTNKVVSIYQSVGQSVNNDSGKKIQSVQQSVGGVQGRAEFNSTGS